MIEIGSLVSVKQTVGCHTPPQYRDRGLGVVLKVAKSKPITFQGVDKINLGDDVTVYLGTGETKVFCEESVEAL